ncbi:hypothetical protein FRC09_015498 [Ceratobasidium sp. 395]|nr:hypothetical protein FRC09_015498 [Ceratobasidium sp. 395]
MNISDGTSTDYRKVVLAVLDMIATDSLTIMRRGQLLTDPVLAISTFSHVDPKNGGPVPATSALTYLNGTVADTPGDTDIYTLTIYNLLCVVIDAVNLDLGSKMYSNMFRNATMFNLVMQPNQAPPGVNSSDWAGGDSSRSFYYGTITPPYQTWAEMLLNGKPFQLSSVTGLEGQESAMVTTYLCPSYQVKPLSSLLTSVFVGSATMTLSAWGVWMLFTTFLAKKIMPPLVQCHCQMCEAKKRHRAVVAAQHAEAVRIAEAAEAANPGVLTRLAARLGLARPSGPARSPSNSDDEEKANSDSAKSSGNPERPGTSTQAARPTDSLDIKHLSYASGSTTA